MAHFERIRDVISGPFSSEIIAQRTASGSIEWRRELPDSGRTNRGRIRRGHSIWPAHLGRLPATGDRTDRKSGAHADDGLARAGLLLLAYRQRLE
jgi:hypothetical protein